MEVLPWTLHYFFSYVILFMFAALYAAMALAPFFRSSLERIMKEEEEGR